MNEVGLIRIFVKMLKTFLSFYQPYFSILTTPIFSYTRKVASLFFSSSFRRNPPPPTTSAMFPSFDAVCAVSFFFRKGKFFSNEFQRARQFNQLHRLYLVLSWIPFPISSVIALLDIGIRNGRAAEAAAVQELVDSPETELMSRLVCR